MQCCHNTEIKEIAMVDISQGTYDEVLRAFTGPDDVVDDFAMGVLKLLCEMMLDPLALGVRTPIGKGGDVFSILCKLLYMKYPPDSCDWEFWIQALFARNENRNDEWAKMQAHFEGKLE